MKKFSLLLATVFILLVAGIHSSALAIDVYVDLETKQLFIEPGPGRKRIGTLKLEDAVDIESPDETHVSEQLKIEEISNDNQSSPDEINESNARIILGQDGAFRFETEDGDFNFRLGGRVHADATFSNNDHFFDSAGNAIEANDGTEIRRGRMKFEGTFFKDWFLKSEVDFADNKIAIKDMFMQYHGFGSSRIRIGEQKQAFSRELQESSNDLLFLERSVMNVLNEPTVDRALGVNIFGQGQSILGFGQNWTGQIGVYGDTIAPNKRNTLADEGWAINSRVTFAPIAESHKVVHLGLAVNYRESNDAKDINDTPLILTYESTHMSNLHLIQTDVIAINNVTMFGLEAHGLLGPFSVGGEYTHSRMDIKESSNLNLHGWYTEASWTLTGESRVYRNGLFYRVMPEKTFRFGKGGLGAWELAARYGEVNLNDGAFKGGKLGNLTLGLNWYPNQIIRFMASYDRLITINNSPLIDRDGSKADNLNTFMFRTQLTF